jgi:hypothetical protein
MMADVASAYDCDDAWSEYLTCVEDKGVCDEETAQFELNKPGTCGASVPVGIPCTQATGCGLPEWSCVNDECVGRACEGSTMPCETNDDCSTGESLCADEMTRLDECTRDASGRDAGIFSVWEDN